MEPMLLPTEDGFNVLLILFHHLVVEEEQLRGVHETRVKGQLHGSKLVIANVKLTLNMFQINLDPHLVRSQL